MICRNKSQTVICMILISLKKSYMYDFNGNLNFLKIIYTRVST